MDDTIKVREKCLTDTTIDLQTSLMKIENDNDNLKLKQRAIRKENKALKQANKRLMNSIKDSESYFAGMNEENVRLKAYEIETQTKLQHMRLEKDKCVVENKIFNANIIKLKDKENELSTKFLQAHEENLEKREKMKTLVNDVMSLKSEKTKLMKDNKNIKKLKDSYRKKFIAMKNSSHVHSSIKKLFKSKYQETQKQLDEHRKAKDIELAMLREKNANEMEMLHQRMNKKVIP
eukprot:UN34126